MTGEAKDPHTLVFDSKGQIWFTSQGSNRVGRLHIATEKVDLITPFDSPSNPYGIVIDTNGDGLGRAAPRRYGRENRSADDGRDKVQGGR